MSIIGRVIDRGIVGPVIGRVTGDDQSALQQIQSMLAGNESVLFNPSMSETLFENYYGGVWGGDAGNGDPVGLMLDMSQRLSLSSNIWTSANVNEFSGWADSGGGVWTATASSSNCGIVASAISEHTVFEVSLTVTGLSGGTLFAEVRNQADTGFNTLGSITSNGTYRFVGRAYKSATGTIFAVRLRGSGLTCVVTPTVRQIAGSHAHQTVSANRPTLQLTSGLWELAGDGVSKYMTADLNMSGNDEFTIVAGAERQGVGQIACYGDITTGTAWALSVFSTNNRSAVASRATSYTDVQINDATPGERFVFTGRANVATPIIEHRRNRSAWEQNTSSQGGGSDYGDQEFSLLANPAAGNYNDSKIQAMIVTSAYLTNSQIELIENYVAELSGVTL